MNRRVLLVGPVSPPHGGIPTYIEVLLSSNLSEKYDFIHINTQLKEKVRNNLFNRAYFSAIKILEIIQAIRKYQPSLSHIHTSSYLGFYEKSLFAFISRIFSVPIILHIHGGEFDRFYWNSDILRKKIIKLLLKIPSKIICLSEHWKDFFKTIATEKKLEVLHNMIDVSSYQQDVSYSFKNKNISFDCKKIILFVGELVKRKGVYDVIKVIPIVKEKIKDCIFVFVGNGNIEKIKGLCRLKGIESNTFFLGEISGCRKISIFLDSDVFILPSYAEGMPITILEAMAAGVPVISTKVGAIPEIIKNGKNGFLIEPGKYNQLAEKIIYLLKNNKLREYIGKNNLEQVRQKYCVNRVISQISKIYDSFIH